MTFYDETLFYGLFGGRNTPNHTGPVANGSLNTPIDYANPYGSVTCGGDTCFVLNANAVQTISLMDLAFPAPLTSDDLPTGATPGATTIGELDPPPDLFQFYIELAPLEYHGYNNTGACVLDAGGESCGPWATWTTPSVEVSGGGGFYREQSGFTNTPGTVVDELTRDGADPDPFDNNPPLPPHDYTLPGSGLFLPLLAGYTPDTGTIEGAIDAQNLALDTLYIWGTVSSVTITVGRGAFSGIFVTTAPGTYHPLGGDLTGAVRVGVRPFWLIGDDEPPISAAPMMLVV